MSLQRVETCPLGSQCERVVDGKLEVCAWYTHIQGEHPQTGERIDQSKCAIAWIPLLTVENSKNTHDAAVAIQTVRNTLAAGLRDARAPTDKRLREDGVELGHKSVGSTPERLNGRSKLPGDQQQD